MTLNSTETKTRLDVEICQDAMKFINVYNTTADTDRRSALVHLYVDEDPLLLWNGNPFRGKDEINRFWGTFPDTKHDVSSLDAHPVAVKLGQEEKSMVIQVMGTISVGGVSRAYNQVLILQHFANAYRIKSDSHRLIE